jgi:hypothetical protein
VTALDNKLGPIALKLIAKYGKQLQIVRTTQGAYDTTTATVSNTSTTTPIKCVVAEWAQSRRYADGKFSTGVILGDGDKILTMAALGIVKPLAGDQFIIDGDAFTVPENGIAITYSGELACIYDVIARNT